MRAMLTREASWTGNEAVLWAKQPQCQRRGRQDSVSVRAVAKNLMVVQRRGIVIAPGGTKRSTGSVARLVGRAR